MSTIVVPPTSKTLLVALSKSDNSPELQASWARFFGLYGPIVATWGRKYRVPADRLADLPGMLLPKLHRAMRFWEFRRWFKTLANSAGKNLVDQIKAVAPMEAPSAAASSSDLGQGKQDLWMRFLTRLTPDVLECLALHQMILAEPGHPEWLETWRSFSLALHPLLASWLATIQSDGERWPVLIADFLNQMEKVIPVTTEANLPRFHSWLHMVVRNAARDMLNEWQPQGEVGDQVTSTPARQDLIAELERREVREEAERRVCSQVSERDWSIYQLIFHDEVPYSEVAQRSETTLANTYKIVERMRKKVGAEIVMLWRVNDDEE